jgi:hypothetical protein
VCHYHISTQDDVTTAMKEKMPWEPTPPATSVASNVIVSQLLTDVANFHYGTHHVGYACLDYIDMQHDTGTTQTRLKWSNVPFCLLMVLTIEQFHDANERSYH